MKPRIIIAVVLVLVAGAVVAGIVLLRQDRPMPEQFKEFAARFAAEVDRERKEQSKSLVVPGGKSGEAFTLISSQLVTVDDAEPSVEGVCTFESRAWTQDVQSGSSLSFKTGYEIRFARSGGKWVPIRAKKRSAGAQGFAPGAGRHQFPGGADEEVPVQRFESAAKAAQGAS